MKKIQVLVTILCSILISTLVFVRHNYIDEHIKFTMNYDNIMNSKDVDIQVLTFPVYSQEKFNAILDDFYELLNKYEIHGYITYAKVDIIDNQVFDSKIYYVSDNVNYIKKNPLLTKLSPEEILQLDNWKITNNPARKNSILIDLADKKRYNINTELSNEIIIQPLEMIRNDKDILTSNVQFGVSAPIGREAEIEEALQIFHQSTGVMDSAMTFIIGKSHFDMAFPEVNIIRDATKMPYSVIWVSFLSIMVIGIYTTIKDFKEISITYLNGYSIWMIFREYFLKFNLLNALIMGGSLLFSSIYLCQSIGPAWLKYFKELIEIYYYYIGFLAISIFLSYLYLTTNFSSNLMKRNSDGSFLTSSLLMIKIVFIIVFVVPIFIAMNVYNYNNGYVNMYKNDPRLEQTQIIGFAAQLSSDENKHHLLKFNEFVYENKLSYYDYYSFKFSDQNPLIDEQNPSLGEYIKHGDLNIPYQYPFVVVNQKFLNDYKGIDKPDGSILVPSQVDKQFAGLNTGKQTEIYHDRLQFDVLNFIDLQTSLINPIIIVDQNAFIKSSSKATYFYQYGDDRGFEDYLEPYSLKYDLGAAVKPIKDIYRTALEGSIAKQKEIQYSLTVLVILMSMINLVTLRIFLDGDSKRIMVKYIHGYTFVNRFGYIVLSVLISSISGLLWVYVSTLKEIGLKYTYLFYLSLFILLLEMGILTYLIRKFEKKHIPSVIKGDAS